MILAPGTLRFPAKVHAAADDRLFVTDTGHHRVLELALGLDWQRARVVRGRPPAPSRTERGRYPASFSRYWLRSFATFGAITTRQ